MRKIAILLCASIGLLGINHASAQLQQGNLLVGANIGNIGLGFQGGNTTFSIGISPKIGYFIRDNIALGGMVNAGFETGDGVTTFDYGVGAFGRYYISQKNMVLMKHARFFGEANAGISGKNVNGDIDYSTNGLGLGFGPGVAYFLTPNIGLEALLKYDLTIGFGNAVGYGRLGINVGFQIYLPSKKARTIYNDAAGELNNKNDN